jgi:hypothetical protein
MRLLYIHIGMHKTGTTSIQWYLHRHARTLKGYGFHVPRAGRIAPRLAGHHNVAWSVLGDIRAQPHHGSLDTLLSELEGSRATRAVMSSEDFEFLADRPSDLMRFEGRILSAGWTPIYLLFLRSPGSYSLSVFQELLRHRNPVHFSAFSDEVLARGTYRSRHNHVLHLDYDLFVAKWRAAAKGELRIRSYDVAASGRGIIAEFMRAIDAPARLGELRQLQLNASAAAVTDDMKATARQIEVKYLPTFMRQTGERVV